MKVEFKIYHLPLKHPFTISRYTVKNQSTAIVSLSNGKYTGYGEATVNPYYGSTIEKLQNSILLSKHIIEKSDDLKPIELWYKLEPLLKEDYFALCAIDCAFWDLFAKQNNRTLRSYWSNDFSQLPLTNYTIGIDTIDNMLKKIIEQPWPVYKIKLGKREDVAIVKALRKVTKSVFRIDANCAWTVEETLDNAIKLKELGVEFIEQPLKTENWEGMKCLKKECVLPLIADESCQRFEDVQKCFEGFHGVNIKLTKCGGITPAIKMIHKARELNLSVMAGCMTESTVGISNLAQIAPLLDYIDADGAMLLANDTAKGVKLEYGSIVYSNKNGSGITLYD